MHPLVQALELYGIIPVVVLQDATDSADVARALIGGGLPCAEVTFRTAAAAKAIETMACEFPEMTIGAGTVLSVEQAKTACNAGAKFIVAPGFNRKVVDFCLDRNVPVMPGICTPSEIEGAMECGLEVVKFFPAEAQGGIDYLKAISAPYRSMAFVPTGGIHAGNLLAYLKASRVLACGGSWMVSTELIAAKKFDEIRRLTEEAVKLMLGFTLRHIGVNGKSEQEALQHSQLMAAMLQQPTNIGSSSVFVGDQFEFTKKPFAGMHGHIAIGTNFAHRAKAYLERRGYKFRSETASEKNGRLLSIYLQDEIAGFALHLLQL